LGKGYTLGEDPPVYSWHLPHSLYKHMVVVGGRTISAETWWGNIDRILILGEFNETLADYDSLYRYIVLGEPRGCVDVWNECYGIAGDLNHDGRVDLGDVSCVAGEWLASDCEIFYDCLDADVDLSGEVNPGDLGVVADDWLRCNVPGDAGCEEPW
jgi:hypothetical protein